jgi:hypothetical protein
MSLRRVIVAVAVAAGVAAFLVASGNEDIEHLVKSETTPYRPAAGEWIKSVPGARAELWAIGDSGAPGDRRVAELIEQAEPDRVLYVGDIYTHGTSGEFRDWNAVWGALVPRMAPTPGNHDWPESSEGYDPFWTDATGEPPPTNYSFRAGGWQIVSLNSEHEERAAQIRWVRELTGAGRDCTIAFWHRPRWSAGPHGDDSAPDDFWRAVRGRVAAVISGHEHNMQRLEPRGGTVQFISGAGGYSQTAPRATDARLAFGDGRHYGALRLRLTSGRAEWAFVAAGGRELDSGVLHCRR